MEKLNNFISTLMIAISNCSLYSKGHLAFDELAVKALSVLEESMEEQFEIMIIDNDLVVNGTPIRKAGLHGSNLIKRLRRKGVSRVDFQKGVSLNEIKQFIIDIAEPGAALKKYPHIRTGAVDVKLGGMALHTDVDLDFDINGLSYSPPDEVEKVKDVLHSASPFKKLNIAGLEEIVVHFIATFRKEAAILKYLSPVKSYSEYTYTHATNVTVLSVFQAESLGIKDDLLHEIGVAALLHDAGKLFISTEILEKKGPLNDREFDEIKKHPMHGAKYLAKMDNLPRLAPIIAFEHHMRYDGSGYPQLHMKKGGRQHICSQIIAVSDFFDALRSRRPYRESMNVKQIFALMRKGVNRDFNPFLVDNFIRLMQATLSE